MYKTLHQTKRELAVEFFESIKAKLDELGKRPADYVYVFPYGGFGEYTYVLGLLNEVRKSKKICLVVDKNKAWLTQVFPSCADFIVQVDKIYPEIYIELTEISWMREGHPFVVFTDHIANGRFNQALVIAESRINLAEGYAFLLELPITTPLTIPLLPERHEQLTDPNTILVIPHANSIENFRKEFWITLCEELKSYQFKVVVNAFESSHKVIGCESLTLPGIELASYAAYCKGVVGLRSGLFDLLGGYAKQKNLKVFPIYNINHNHSRCSTGIQREGISQSGLSIRKIWQEENICEFEAFGDNCAKNIAASIAQNLYPS
jgi:hypothetical protein